MPQDEYAISAMLRVRCLDGKQKDYRLFFTSKLPTITIQAQNAKTLFLDLL
jgi:hypothetical protein